MSLLVLHVMLTMWYMDYLFHIPHWWHHACKWEPKSVDAHRILEHGRQSSQLLSANSKYFHCCYSHFLTHITIQARHNIWVEWFTSGIPVSFTNKPHRHNTTEILLKVAYDIIALFEIYPLCIYPCYSFLFDIPLHTQSQKDLLMMLLVYQLEQKDWWEKELWQVDMM